MTTDAVTGFLVVEVHTDGCSYHCDVAVKVWLDRSKAEDHVKALNLDAYRKQWIWQEQNRRLKAMEERLPRISPKDHLQVRMDTLRACERDLPSESLGLTETPEGFDGPFDIREIEVE